MLHRTIFVCFRLNRVLWLIFAIFVVCFGFNYVLGSKNKERAEEIYLSEARDARDKLNLQTLKELRAAVDDTNASKESREAASKKYIKQVEDMDKESRIELTLKGRGYKEVICSIDGNNAKILVKSQNPMDEKEIFEIQSFIKSTFGIDEVYIQNNNFRGSFYAGNLKMKPGLKSWFLFYGRVYD